MTIQIQRESGSDHVTESSRGSVQSLCVINSGYAAENRTGMACSVIYWTFTRRLWVAPSVIPPPRDLLDMVVMLVCEVLISHSESVCRHSYPGLVTEG